MKAVEGGREISLLYHEDPLCRQALNIMLSTYGSEVGYSQVSSNLYQTGNVALKYLPYGGIYIAGGIAPVHESKIADPSKSDFLRAYKDRGRVSGVLDNIRVVIVKADDLGLRGAHFVANTLHHGDEAKQKVQDIQPQPYQTPQANPLDSVFYHCGVATVAVLSVVGLSTVFKLLQR